ncbi:MAG: TetR/AcrR family transcriptional regulator, partial [Caldilineaceae bacterium]|nr:TetR/AcrR family transcriptional regulator [Caldilineaceae bacterium]
MSQNDDLRVRRTRKMLRDAFIALVLEEGFEAITVNLLAERAMINRATFYRHYADKYELAERVYADLTDDYMASVQTLDSTDPVAGWTLLFAHVAEYADFYLALLSGIPHFQERVRDQIEEQLHQVFSGMGLNEAQVVMPLPLSLRYLAAAQMGVVQWWLETGRAIPARQMAQY